MTAFRQFFLPLILILTACTGPAVQHTHDSELADKFYQQGCTDYENGELDSCAIHLTKAFGLYQENGNKEEMSVVCLSLGELYNEINALDSAKFYLSKGVELATLQWTASAEDCLPTWQVRTSSKETSNRLNLIIRKL